MTLPSSGPISLQQINAEFVPSNPSRSNVRLQDFYAGGAYVQAGTKNGLGSAIPTGGQLSLQTFYGASRYLSALNGQTITVNAISSDTGGNSAVFGSIVFNSNGTISYGVSDQGNATGPSTWVSPADANSGSKFQMEISSYTANSNNDTSPINATNNAGSWSNLPYSITVSATSQMLNNYSFTMKIRDSLTAAVVATFTVNMSVKNNHDNTGAG